MEVVQHTVTKQLLALILYSTFVKLKKWLGNLQNICNIMVKSQVKCDDSLLETERKLQLECDWGRYMALHGTSFFLHDVFLELLCNNHVIFGKPSVVFRDFIMKILYCFLRKWQRTALNFE